jgi:hypothetical protein
MKRLSGPNGWMEILYIHVLLLRPEWFFFPFLPNHFEVKVAVKETSSFAWYIYVLRLVCACIN